MRYAILLALLGGDPALGLRVTSPFFKRATPRSTSATCLEAPPLGVVVTILSGIFIFTRPESALWGLVEQDVELSVEQETTIKGLCRTDGWELRLAVGADTLADSGTTVELTLQLGFNWDDRFRAYPQGTAKLLRSSRFMSLDSGLWSIEALEQRDGSPSGETSMAEVLELRMQCDGLGPAGGADGAQELLPRGPVYLSATLEADERATRVAALTSGKVQNEEIIRFGDGRITVKEYSSIGVVAGLSELKVVGSFEARPL